MKIGIDVDGVIVDSDEAIRVAAELYDLLELKGNGTINKEAMLAEDRFGWTEEERRYFLENRVYYASLTAPFMPGAIDILKMLINEGHELVLITARGNIEPRLIQEINDRLQREKIEFSKKFFKVKNKVQVAVQEKLDIMIDDRWNISQEMSIEKIHALYFRNVNRLKIEENEFLHEVNNWGEIYRKIKELSKL